MTINEFAMKMDKGGGPAFPIIGAEALDETGGMSLRDYFAAAVINGMLSADKVYAADSWSIQASIAYEAADAMLNARESKDAGSRPVAQVHPD